MDQSSYKRFENRLLARLPEVQESGIAAALEPVDLPQGTIIESPFEPITHVYFLESGVGSVITRADGQQAETGLFGREGMSGCNIVLGDDRSPHLTTVQVPGRGYRVEAAVIREALAGPALRGMLLSFAQCMWIQASYTALANARLKIEARLSRWLLMCHDRVDGDEIALTHDFLSIMLGVRRAGVTVALHVLEGEQLIRASRGVIRIVDREGLRKRAGGFYGVAEQEYERLLRRV
ncbi:Crp/Fnr family transcriptional regulator [Pseudoroseicyclus aestuarii]|uniref:CRP-like cAMP-binding protein n=1 Tax=Pseudoroseicyclus aestuarii TaxID=1795041 RepID=A0A318SRR9_9RHOB|nr:Crp/Fnr family transcriptional regulator [Pseudoroseicyclus aestuarii]PYE84631.1 CRP-like cAMP-binding protein [Pseudoroseicyclus aestuarii]